jgi:hypothetical protein
MDEQHLVSDGLGKSRVGGLLLLSIAFAALLGGVFYLYTNPQLVIMLTDQLWACF